MRINVNLPDDLLKMIDDYAEKNGVTRTSAMIFLLSQQLIISRNEDEKEHS